MTKKKTPEKLTYLLQEDKALEMLDLSYNKIGNKGVIALVNELLKSNTLEVLNFRKNNIGTSVMKKLKNLVVTKIQTIKKLNGETVQYNNKPVKYKGGMFEVITK